MRATLISILVLIASIVSAQKDTLVYYFHKNGNECPKEYASFVTYIVPENGIFKFSKHDLENGTIIMSGCYADSACTIREGWWIYRTSSKPGSLSDSIYFEGGKTISSIRFSYYSNGQLYSRTLKNFLKGIKEFSEWTSEGNLNIKTILINNTGDQENYYSGGELKSVEHYVDGFIVATQYYNQDGSEMNDSELKKHKKKEQNELEKRMAERKKEIEEKTPSFPGGMAGFNSFFAKSFKTPASLVNQINNVESVSISFYLDEDGFAYDIKITSSNDLNIQSAVSNVFKSMPRWNMKGYKKYGPVTYQLKLRR